MDADTFRPIQENNVLEMRAFGAASSYPIVQWNGFAASDHINIVISAPGGNKIIVGDIIDVVGASVGNLGTNINGTDYGVIAISDTAPFRYVNVAMTFSADEYGLSAGGTVRVHGTANIDAQLSVRNIIQAIAYA
jgi:hypothetical protein